MIINAGWTISAYTQLVDKLSIVIVDIKAMYDEAQAKAQLEEERLKKEEEENQKRHEEAKKVKPVL